MAIDNTVLARRYINEIWSKGNFDVIDELIAPDALFRDTFLPEARGPDAFRSKVKDMRIAFPDLAFTIEEVIALADRVLVRSNARGTHRGPLAGIPATGRMGSGKGVDLMKVSNGKITEVLSYWDALSLFQQLGVVPTLDKLVRGTSTRPAPSART